MSTTPARTLHQLSFGADADRISAVQFGSLGRRRQEPAVPVDDISRRNFTIEEGGKADIPVLPGLPGM